MQQSHTVGILQLSKQYVRGAYTPYIAAALATATA